MRYSQLSITDRELLFTELIGICFCAPRVLSAARVTENWFSGSPSMVRVLSNAGRGINRYFLPFFCWSWPSVPDGFWCAEAKARLHDVDYGAFERAWGVILVAVAAGVAHVLDLGLVEVREFVLLGLRAESEFVNVVDDLAQVVA